MSDATREAACGDPAESAEMRRTRPARRVHRGSGMLDEPRSHDRASTRRELVAAHGLLEDRELLVISYPCDTPLDLEALTS